MKKSLLLIIAVIFYAGCEENVEQDYITYDCDELRSYYTDLVKPILESNGCTGCHVTSNPSGGLVLDSFENAVNGIMHGNVLDRVNREPTDIGFMPKIGSKLSQNQLDILQGFSDMECPQ